MLLISIDKYQKQTIVIQTFAQSRHYLVGYGTSKIIGCQEQNYVT